MSRTVINQENRISELERKITMSPKSKLLKNNKTKKTCLFPLIRFKTSSFIYSLIFSTAIGPARYPDV